MVEVLLKETDWDSLPRSEAELRYLPAGMANEVDGNAILENLFSPIGSGLENSNVKVPLYDVSSIRDELSIDRQGFVFSSLSTDIKESMAREEMAAIWVPAAERLLQDITGASAIASFEFTVRYSERSDDPRKTPFSAPASAVHGDFGPAQFKQRVHHLDAEAALQRVTGSKTPRRWRCFNVWQPISPPPYDSLLTVCDTRTVSADDLVVGMATAERPGEKFDVQLVGFKHRAEHRWAYCSDMGPQDILVFSGFDPSCDSPYRIVPHSAFLAPGCPPNSIPRNSVELRAVAVFD